MQSHYNHMGVIASEQINVLEHLQNYSSGTNLSERDLEIRDHEQLSLHELCFRLEVYLSIISSNLSMLFDAFRCSRYRIETYLKYCKCSANVSNMASSKQEFGAYEAANTSYRNTTITACNCSKKSMYLPTLFIVNFNTFDFIRTRNCPKQSKRRETLKQLSPMARDDELTQQFPSLLT